MNESPASGFGSLKEEYVPIYAARWTGTPGCNTIEGWEETTALLLHAATRLGDAGVALAGEPLPLQYKELGVLMRDNYSPRAVTFLFHSLALLHNRLRCTQRRRLQLHDILEAPPACPWSKWEPQVKALAARVSSRPCYPPLAFLVWHHTSPPIRSSKGAELLTAHIVVCFPGWEPSHTPFCLQFFSRH